MASSTKLSRTTSMRERVEDTLFAHRNEIVSLLSRYVAQGKAILQPHQILDELENITGDDASRQKLTDGPFGEVLKTSQATFGCLLKTYGFLTPDFWRETRFSRSPFQ